MVVPLVKTTLTHLYIARMDIQHVLSAFLVPGTTVDCSSTRRRGGGRTEGVALVCWAKIGKSLDGRSVGQDDFDSLVYSANGYTARAFCIPGT